MVQPVDWIPPCNPNGGEAAERYNKAHREAFDRSRFEHLSWTWMQHNAFAREECERQGITRNTAPAAVVALPVNDPTDIPARLRSLAEMVERGDYGDAHNLAWVIDAGSGRIEMGLLGKAATIGAELHLLLSAAALRIAHGVVKWDE